MTNAEYYLKEGIKKEELYEKIPLIFYDGYSDNDVQKVKNFFEEKYVALTEDERVILRSIQDKQKVIFNDGSNLWTRDVEGEDNFFGQFNHLFQFIKNGEEYSIEGLLNG